MNKKCWKYRNDSIIHLTVMGNLFFKSRGEVESNSSKASWGHSMCKGRSRNWETNRIIRPRVDYFSLWHKTDFILAQLTALEFIWSHKKDLYFQSNRQHFKQYVFDFFTLKVYRHSLRWLLVANMRPKRKMEKQTRDRKGMEEGRREKWDKRTQSIEEKWHTPGTYLF